MKGWRFFPALKGGLLFLMGCLFSSFISAQEYDRMLEHCFRLFESGDSLQFEQAYPALFYGFYKQSDPSFGQISQYIEEGDYEAACLEINSLIEEDFLTAHIFRDPSFSPLHDFSGWQLIVSRMDSLEKAHDMTLKTELLYMQDQDQSLRLMVMAASHRYADNRELLIRLREKMKEVDRRNAARAQEILDEFGWLGPDIIGEDGNQSLFLVIQHVDDLSIQDKYLPMLRTAVQEKKAEPWHYAFLTDRIRLNQGGKQIYGTQVITSFAGAYVVPLQEPDRVDELRREVGLDPLADYLMEEHGIEWDINTYKMELPRIEEEYQKYLNERNL